MHSDLRKKRSNTLDSSIRGAFLFSWHVAADYRWASGDDFQVVPEMSGDNTEPIDWEGPWLLASGQEMTYSPIKDERIGREFEPALHREFGALGVSQEAIVTFVSLYGLLGKSAPISPIGGGQQEHGESIGRWREEIGIMAGVVAVWDLVKQQDLAQLGKVIIWSPKGVALRYSLRRGNGKYHAVSYAPNETPATDTVISAPFLHPELLNGWKPGEVVEPALYYVCRELNRNLRRCHIAPQVLPFKDKKVYLVPDNLLSSMWLMFMWEVTGSIEVCLCGSCLRWFRQRDPRQKWCENRCRQRVYENKPKGEEGAP